MIRDLSHISMSGRQSGKTTAMAKAAKEIGAILLCHNDQEAKRVAKEFGCKTKAITARLRGLDSPFLVDTHAVGQYAYEMERRVQALESRCINLRKNLEFLKGQVDGILAQDESSES
jgi:hypothetical protein